MPISTEHEKPFIPQRQFLNDQVSLFFSSTFSIDSFSLKQKDKNVQSVSVVRVIEKEELQIFDQKWKNSSKEWTKK